jgi:phosphate transport system protein
MATIPVTRENFSEASLVNYLISMARTVEGSVNRAIEALLRRNEALASEIFLLEPHVNEMEILIDERAVRLLRTRDLHDETIRFVVASIKINNDLERMADMAVNIAQRVFSLAQMSRTEPPAELEPMSMAVRAMVSKSLGALIYRNVELAKEVLESDDVVDKYRDVIFERLLAGMTADPSLIAPNLQFVLTARCLERIADHTTNISEDVLFWLRGLEVRHGRGFPETHEDSEPPRLGLAPAQDPETGVPDLP